MDIAHEDELHKDVKPLSKREIKWMERLERTLLACPTARLELATSGDPCLQVIDGKVTYANNFEICDGKATDNGVQLGYVNSRPNIAAITN